MITARCLFLPKPGLPLVTILIIIPYRHLHKKKGVEKAIHDAKLEVDKLVEAERKSALLAAARAKRGREDDDAPGPSTRARRST